MVTQEWCTNGGLCTIRECTNGGVDCIMQGGRHEKNIGGALGSDDDVIKAMTSLLPFFLAKILGERDDHLLTAKSDTN